MATVGLDGSVSVAKGQMADGTTFSAGGAVSADGKWPLYGSLNSGKGSVLAWVQFPRHSASSQTTSGQAMWFETAPTFTNLYPTGFTLLTNQLSWLANRYVVPRTGASVLTNGHYSVEFFGGGLSSTLTIGATLKPNNVVVLASNTNQLSLTLNPLTGLRAAVPQPGHWRDDRAARHFVAGERHGLRIFPGTNQDGGILLQP